MHPNRDDNKGMGQDTQQIVPKDAELADSARHSSSVLCVTRLCGKHLRPHKTKSQISVAESVSAHRKDSSRSVEKRCSEPRQVSVFLHLLSLLCFKINVSGCIQPFSKCIQTHTSSSAKHIPSMRTSVWSSSWPTLKPPVFSIIFLCQQQFFTLIFERGQFCSL